jgi:hypothetical protein
MSDAAIVDGLERYFRGASLRSAAITAGLLPSAFVCVYSGCRPELVDAAMRRLAVPDPAGDLVPDGYDDGRGIGYGN